jgi:hypothetical protein
MWEPPQIVSAGMVTRRNFHAEDPQLLGATVENLVACASWRTGFVDSYSLFVFKRGLRIRYPCID